MRLTLSAAFAALLTISPVLSAQPAPIVGTAASPAEPGMQAASGPRRVRISGGVMAGQSLTHVDPVYPEEARNSGVEGTVVLHVIVATDGTVESATVVSGPEVLQKATIDAVRHWTYRPYLLNGEPTEVDTTATVNFKLNPEPQPQP